MRRANRVKANRGKMAYKDPGEWGGRMKDVPCFILGNGPSIGKQNLSLLDGYFTVGINRIFFLYDPTVLIWQDLALWIQEKKRVMETKALKFVRRGADTRGGFYAFKLEGKDPRLTDNIKTLYGRGSSGSVTYQFVHALGCNPIVLLGMDCRNDPNGNTDFYGVNPMHKPHTLPNCVKGLRFIARSHGQRRIIDCSENRIFKEKHTLEQALKIVGDRKYNRETLLKMLLGS